MNGLSKITGLVKFHSSRSLIFERFCTSLSLNFFAKPFQSLNLVSQFKKSWLSRETHSSRSLKFTICHPYIWFQSSFQTNFSVQHSKWNSIQLLSDIILIIYILIKAFKIFILNIKLFIRRLQVWKKNEIQFSMELISCSFFIVTKVMTEVYTFPIWLTQTV